MKIALVTRRYPPLIGGAERVLSYLAPALAAEGAEVDVLTSRRRRACRRSRTLGVVPGGPPGDVAGPVRRDLALHAGAVPLVRPEPGRPGLCLDAQARCVRRVGEGRRRGFPVVLRPEGAGATGDLAWQKLGAVRPPDRPALPAGRRLRGDLAERPGRAGRGRVRPGPDLRPAQRRPGARGPLASLGTTRNPSAPRSSAGSPPRRGSMPWSTPGRSSSDAIPRPA